MGDTVDDLAARLERDGSVSIDHERFGPWMTAISCGLVAALCLAASVAAPFVGEWVALLIALPLGVLMARMAVVGVRMLIKRRGAVVIDAAGITVPSRQMVLPWKEVFGAQRRSFRGHEILHLLVSEALFEKYSPWHVKLLRRIPLGRRQAQDESELLGLPHDLRVSGSVFAAWICDEARRR